jgi:ribose transport system ATP-binding protein
MTEQLVSMEGIEKSFPGVRALDHCRFELRAGEVHALVGENGAGKSTLMKVLAGVYRCDAGAIQIGGRAVAITSPRAARDLGISIIHQELNLMPHLTVAQNIFIGREPRRRLRFLLDERAINEQARALLDRLRLRIDPRTRVSDLTVARQQIVEIARALSLRSRVLIMDEPTAALTDAEVAELFRITRELRDKGVGVVHISHRLEELPAISDRITVMRDGRTVETLATRDAAIDQIIHLMVGRTIYEGAPEIPDLPHHEVVLELRHVCRGRALRDISFTLRRGEILGLAGLVGAGGIFGANEGSAVGVLNAVKELRMQGKLVVIGYDAGKQQKDAVRSGVMAGAVSQDPVGIGYKCVETAVKAIKGEKVPKAIDTGYKWYDKTNVDSAEMKPLLYD